jgi:hypothetical protein
VRRPCTVTAVSSSIQTVADLDARDDQAAALARRLTAWLAERGILDTSPTNCLLDSGLGYAPGPRAWDLVTDWDRPQGGGPWGNGVKVVTGRTVFETDVPLSAGCPGCAESVVLTDQETWGITPAWDAFDRAVGAWLEGGSSTVPCPRCQRPVSFNDWRWPDGGGWALGFLGLEFWDWPGLSRGFLREVSQFLGHRLLLIRGRY